MTLSRKLRLPLRGAALALCSVAIVALATPASARPHHGASRHYHAHHSKHHARKHYGHRYRHHARRGRYAAAAATAEASTSQGFGGFGGSNIVAEARRYIGSGNPTGRSSLWCARFMNMVLERSGHKGTGSDMARSFAGYGQRISGPQVGAIAVMSRGRRGGHVGIVSGIDAKGNPIVISGNHGHRVAEATYSRGRVYAYVMPSS
ncbi:MULTISPECIES: TIGR02594 family protein [unclassified Afipia]|uniref:TIGR02594 family protein n=1 Tax=unclassified Afipia TaxID=2642050 RepID=UPI000401DFE9|nr:MULTISPECIES: TIGR02594 family protein [unclassified Afipia]